MVAGGGLRLLPLLAAFIGITSAAFLPVTAFADVTWSNIYSCSGAPNSNSPCGGSGWSCTWSHDGTYGTSVDANGVEHTKNYHYYVCTWSGGSGGGETGGGTGGGGTSLSTYTARIRFQYNKPDGVTSNPTNWPNELTHSTQASSDPGSYTFVISSQKPQLTGYTFKGWAKSSAATTPAYGGDTGNVRVPATYGMTTNLYAVWQKDAVKVKLTYNANNAATPVTAFYTRNQNEKVTVADPAKDTDLSKFTAPSGKQFTGWNTQPGGWGTQYQPGDTITLSADTTLYAQWGPASAPCVAQMPTTGAPEGLTTVGLIALGVSMLGLGVGLARRRSS